MPEAIEYSTHEYRAQIMDLVAKLNDAERLNNQLQENLKSSVSRNDYLILEKDYENAERRLQEAERRLQELEFKQSSRISLITESAHLQDKIKNLEGIINSNEAEQKSRFKKIQTIAINGMDAVILILTIIAQANTAHWQKKENLRNAIAVLQSVQKRIAKADPSPLPFDDDF